jgi:hypothetical protein
MRLRQRANLARQRRFDAWSATLTEGDAVAGFEANPSRYLSPGSYDISYAFVPFRPDEEPFERQRVAEQFTELLRGGVGDDEIERLCDAEGAEYVRLGIVSGTEALWLGPEPHRRLITMDPGEVSQPIQVSGGMLVLEVDDLSPRRQLELPDDLEPIRSRHAELKRKQFLAELPQQVLAERSFQLLSTEVFDGGSPESAGTEG